MARAPAGTGLDLGGDVFQVVVGQLPEQKTYYLHHNVVYQRSDFFKNCLSKSDSFQWIEGETGKVKLEAEDPKLFDLYVQLIYSGLLHTTETPMANANLTDVRELLTLSKLYALLDFLRDEKAKLAVYEAFCARAVEKTGFPVGRVELHEVVNIIYEIPVTNNMDLRKFIVDQYAKRRVGAWDPNVWEMFNVAFRNDSLNSLFEQKRDAAIAPPRKTPDTRYK